MNQVSITFTANDRDLIQSYEKRLALQDKEIRKLQQVGGAGRKAGQETETGMGGVVTKLATMVAGYASVTQAVGFWKRANEEVFQQAEEAGKKFDELFRKFRVQAGLRGLEGERAQQRIVAEAEIAAVPVEQAAAAATQLVSSGFSAEAASGDVLREFLAVLSASNIRGAGVDPTELAGAITKYLTSQGLELSAENVARVGQNVQGLFRATNIQLPQLANLAKEGAVLAGKLTPEEQFATFSRLVDVFGEQEAATNLRNVVGRLSTARETPGRVDALKRLGLSPDDVDFIDETAFEVFDRLKAGLESVPAKEREGLLKKLFEEAGVAPAKVILENIPEIRRRTANIGDEAAFRSDVAEATSGRGAGAVRGEVRRERRRAAKDELQDLFLEEFTAALEEEGAIAPDVAFQKLQFKLARSLGLSPEQSVQAANFLDPERAARVSAETTRRVEERQTGAADQAKLVDELRKNTDATKQNSRAVPRPSPEKQLSRTN